MRRFPLRVFASIVLAWSANAAAAEPVETPGTSSLTTIVVTGEQPGPGLWRVSKGDHVLWVLGTLSPLPRHMQWRAKEVDERVGESQEVLLSPSMALTTGLGFFGQLGLLPSLIGLRNNPDGKTLADVVPAPQYARWSALKARYIGRSGKVEKWRPLFAAMELYENAIDKAGLVQSGQITDVVRKAAKRAGATLTPVKLEIELDDAKIALKEFKHDPIDDGDCFERTLDRIEGDLDTMAARANAWASGDLDALRALPYTDQMSMCREAVSASGVAHRHGLGDVESRVRQSWVDAATAALERNRSSFALLPMARLLGDGDYLSGLRSRGYIVQSPEEQAAGESGATALGIAQ